MKISFTATLQAMGDADEDSANRYVAALQEKLSLAYPNADVKVTRDDRLSSSVIQVSDQSDWLDVKMLSSEIWSRGDF